MFPMKPSIKALIVS